MRATLALRTSCQGRRYLDDGEDHVNEYDEQKRHQQDRVAEGARDRWDSLRGTVDRGDSAEDNPFSTALQIWGQNTWN